MTSEQLGAIAGLILSLAFSYIPGLNDRFAALNPTQKRLSMAALLLVVAVGALGLSCADLLNAVACTRSGAINLVTTFIAALVANQAAFLISPQRTP